LIFHANISLGGFDVTVLVTLSSIENHSSFTSKYQGGCSQNWADQTSNRTSNKNYSTI